MFFLPPLRITHFFCLFLFSTLVTSAAAESPHQPEILFDEAHGMRFVIDMDGPLHLSGLAAMLRDRGARVEKTRQRLNKQMLAGKNALVISGPFADYTGGEIDAVVNFLLNGGKCAVMLHIPNPASFLLQRLNVLVSNGIVHEQENMVGDSDKDFYVSALAPHPITEGLPRFAVYGAWALLNDGPNVEPLGTTGTKAWVDLDRDGKLSSGDPNQAFALLVTGKLGQGEYVVFGDDAIFQNRFLVDDNRKLAENLAAWLLR